MKGLFIAVVTLFALNPSAFASGKSGDGKDAPILEASAAEPTKRAPATKKSEENIDVDAALKEMQTAFESMDVPDSTTSNN